MSWSARQLLFRPDPEIIAALRTIPSLEGHIYHVPHLRDFATTSEEPFAVMFPTGGGPAEEVSRPVTRVRAFPPAGLVFVSKFADPEDDRASPAAVNWNCFDLTAIDAPCPFEGPAAERCFSGAPDWLANKDAPESMRRAAATLAHRTRSIAAYLSIETWGGDLEYAVARVFDGREGRRTFLRDTSRDDRDDRDEGPDDLAAPGVVEVTAARSRFIAAGDVLTLALLHFDVLLRDGYFEPHTSGFPWDRYRIG
jgi:hypothetical protein